MAAPTATEGTLVIEPNSSTNREIIYYTGVSGSSVTLPSVGAGRGQEGTTAAAHSSGVTVKRNTTSRDFEVLQDGSAMAVGHPIQVVGATNTLNGTTTTAIPADDTIPQSTEGVEVTTQAITPKDATNILVIEAWQLCSPSVAGTATIALFQDSTANALAASEFFMNQNGGVVTAYVKYIMTAGTASSTTFKYRVGTNSANTFTYGARYSTAHTGGIMITEYKA